MFKKTAHFIIAIFFLLNAYSLLHVTPAHAAVGLNRVINFQGRVTNKADGTNITDGTYSFTFKLYDASSNGNLLWQETQSSVTITAGVFQVTLGSSTAFNAGGFNVDFTQNNLYLDITFNGETFGSRVRLASVPQAINAEQLDGVVATQSATGYTLTGGLSNPKTLTLSDSTTLATNSITFGGGEVLTLTASNGLTLATTGTTNVTLPTSGTLVNTGVTSLSSLATVGSLVTGTVVGTNTFNSHAILDSGALSITSNTSNAITIDSGTTGNVNIGTGANGKTIAIGNNTGNTAITLTSGGTGTIALGSNTGLGNVIVQPNAGGQAALVINTQGLGDVFTASVSGTPAFRITQTGGVLLQGDILVASGSGTTNGSAFTNALGDSGSLVPNAGFEAALTGQTFADGWYPAASNSAAVARDTNTKAKGTASAKITLSANQSTAIYSVCLPLALSNSTTGSYNINWYEIGSSSSPVVRAYLDGFTSKANCQGNTTPTLTTAQGGNITNAWSTQSGAALKNIGANITWARVHFFVGCPATCAANSTVNIDGVRLIENALTGGVDYAENYPGDPLRPVEPGDVVGMEASRGAALVVPDATPEDPASIGVVSTKPGEILDDGTITGPIVTVALAGRVPVKVSTINGPIHVGDYLTSSTIPGVAVKASNPGQVIGVAMEDDTTTDPSAIGQVMMFLKNTYYSGTSVLAGTTPGMQDVLGASTASVIPLTAFSSGLATVSGDLRVKGNGLVEGILTVIDSLVAHNMIVNGTADFFSKTIFHGDTSFEKTPQLNTDTAGFAVIPKGADHIDVVFSSNHPALPIVSATMVSLKPSLDLQETLFTKSYGFVVTNITPKGFTIVLNKTAQDDVTFSWTAFASQ